MKYLFKLGDGWTWSKIYFDAEKDSFIEERYHEEYLDTGTICDGDDPISDQELWDRMVKEVNEEGINEFLKIRGAAPPCPAGNGVTMREFWERLSALKVQKPYRAYSYSKVDSVHVLYDENKTILGVISNTDHYWYFIDTQKHGFNSREETFEYALKRVEEYHNRRLKNDVTNK